MRLLCERPLKTSGSVPKPRTELLMRRTARIWNVLKVAVSGIG